jgi:hypothetical protein
VAQHVEMMLVDDLDGSEAAETVTFQRGRIPDAWVADYDTKSPNPPQQAESTAVQASEDEQHRRMSGVEAPMFQAV